MQEVQSTFPVGTIIRGQYLVQKLLSKSDHGAIYLVRDQRARLHISHSFVLKEMFNPTRQERNRFMFKSISLKQLDHPALPPIYATFNDETRSRFYILMSYLEGPNLETLQQGQPRQRFSLSETMTMMEPLLEAVTYLHSQQPPIIHGNIEPTNIIIPVADAGAKLVGLGITKEFGTTSTAEVIPIPSSVSSYMAPEQYYGKSSTRSDIYALGAILYTLLTGITPSDALYRLQQISQKKPDPLIPLNQIHRSVPLVVAKVVHRALFINANSRFSTVQHFKRELEASLKGQSAPLLLIRAKQASNAALVRQLPHEQIKEVVLEINSRQQPPHEPIKEVVLEINPILQEAHEEILVPSAPSELVTSIAPSHLPIEANGEVKKPVRVSSQKQARVQRRRTTRERFLITVALCIALLIGVGTGASHWFAILGHYNSVSAISIAVGQHNVPPSHATTVLTSKDAVTPTPVSTAAANPGQLYAGMIYNLAQKISSKMSLIVLQQQGKISGYFTGLDTTGSFKGTMTTARDLQFAVMGNTGQAALSFQGHVLSDGTLTGNYCSLNQNNQCSGEYGLWSVVPA